VHSPSLTCDGYIRSRLFFSPGRHKHCDVNVTPLQEKVHCQQNSQTGKNFLVPVAKKQFKKKNRFEFA